MRTDLTEAEALGLGFRPCWAGLYNQSVPLADVQAACGGSALLMACRPVGERDFTVAAMGQRSEVLTDVGDGREASHDHNGVQWYFSNNASWGFAPVGEPISRNRCDTANTRAAERMCWHTNAGDLRGGWSCGAARNLNGSDQWERVVYQRDTGL